MESRYFVQGVSKFENHKEGRHPVNSESQGMPNQTGETGLSLLKHTVSLLPVDFFSPGIEPGVGMEEKGGCTFKAIALLLGCIFWSLCE